MAGAKRLKRLHDPYTGLYIHIPYCGKKCPYCDFNSFADGSVPERRYVDALIRELDHYLENGPFNRPIDTLYIGGGTPSFLSLRATERIVGHVRSVFEWAPDFEATIEANPSSIDRDKLEGYLSSGINRISLGVQSFCDAELSVLGRTHSAREASGAFNMAREAGFTNIGLDLIYAIPGQSLASFKKNLARAVELRPEHISVYGLTLEEGTAMQSAVGRGDIEMVSEDVEAACYKLAAKVLSSSGYTHYEISNFALAGKESRHNTRYWEGRDFLGLGAGAHSCSIDIASGAERTKRWWNIKDPESYMALVEARGSAKEGEESLAPEQRRLEALYLGLRLLKGIDVDSFKAEFKVTPMELLDDIALRERLVSIDKGAGQGDIIRLTPRGLLFSNELF